MSTEKLFDGEGITSSERYFYTPSAFARKHLCYVQELGSLKSLKPHASVRENLESFLFFVVRAGSGCVRYEGKEIELKSGDAVLLDCREHYEHESSVNNPWELSWVHFDGARAEAVYGLFKKENGGQPRIVLGRREEAVSRLLAQLMEGKGENSLRAELKADALLAQLLLLVMEMAGERQEETDFDGLREEVNAGLSEADITLEHIHERLTQRYKTDFSKIDDAFRAKYGISIDGYAANRMLNKAKELLRFTIEPIPAVAAASGMSGEEELRRLFQENEQMSPEDYRKKWAQWIKG
ncbi:MAG: AraC family ligand binding domain-containing protein [Lachnospiraceae bacterium]|nr:AraC family ligand binding domain-containing protein [Lachnospiraceae bacterium]